MELKAKELEKERNQLQRYLFTMGEAEAEKERYKGEYEKLKAETDEHLRNIRALRVRLDEQMSHV